MKAQRFIERLKGEFSFVQGNILVLMVSGFMTTFSRSVPETYYSLFIEELGGTPFTIGLIGFASLTALALVQLPGGYLADKYGRKRLIVAATFGSALAYLLCALAPSWHLVLVGAVISSLCLIDQAALGAIMADSLPPERRGMGFSAMRIVEAVSVVSPLVAGFLCAVYGLVQGMRIAYLFATVAFLLAAVVRMKLRETLKADAKGMSLLGVVKSYPAAVRESLAVWRIVPSTMLYLFLVEEVSTFFAQMCMPYYVVYATEILSIERTQWSMLLTLQSAVTFCSLLPVGKIIDAFGRKKMLVMVHLTVAVAMLLFIYGDLTKLAMFFVLSGICNSMLVAYQSLEADLVPREHRGKVWGSMQFFTAFAASIGQLLGGFLYEHVSPRTPFLLLLASTVPCAILTLLLVHE
jgi:MFS family permease